MLLHHDSIWCLSALIKIFIYFDYIHLFTQLLYLACFTINAVITPVVSLIKCPVDRVMGWKASIWATEGLVNITYYTGALVKLIPIHLMISSINIYSCVLLLSSATKHAFFNFIAQTLFSMNSLHHLKGKETISWIVWKSLVWFCFPVSGNQCPCHGGS